MLKRRLRRLLPEWLLLAVPLVVVLTWGATRLLRTNWRSRPQYLDDAERDRVAAYERAEARHARFRFKLGSLPNNDFQNHRETL